MKVELLDLEMNNPLNQILLLPMKRKVVFVTNNYVFFYFSISLQHVAIFQELLDSNNSLISISSQRSIGSISSLSFTSLFAPFFHLLIKHFLLPQEEIEQLIDDQQYKQHGEEYFLLHLVNLHLLHVLLILLLCLYVLDHMPNSRLHK